jgi:type III restriction enzyme
VKLLLKDFQEVATADLIERAGWAKGDVVDRGPQTLTLSAPTGSGKTMIAIAWMERLIDGDDSRSADPDATFLWITDQPMLNEQTRRKFETTSTIFDQTKLVTIDASFKKATFDPGTVYFLNTQKLGRDKLLISKGDDRPHTLWETINNTASERSASFWVILDEAHKGMIMTNEERDQALTIVQKFIVGSEEIGPVPLVLGISATPDRFTNMLAGTARMNHPAVNVLPEDVRGSGLLKQAITLYHPD